MSEMSDKFDVVLSNLMKAKREMGSAVKKDSANPFHKSKYASLGAHLELSESILDRHGLIMVQTVNGSQDKAMLVSTLCHPESGQWIKSYLPLPNPKNDSQGLGASITYMRRYSINTMLGLSAEDDDAESACIREPKTPAKKAPSQFDTNENKVVCINEDQFRTLSSLERKLDEPTKKHMQKALMNEFNINSISQATADMYQSLIIRFENAIRYMDQNKKQVAHA